MSKERLRGAAVCPKAFLLCVVKVLAVYAVNPPEQAYHCFPVNLSGIASLQEGLYERAIDEIGKDTSGPAVSYRYFKLGIAQEKLGRSAVALGYYQKGVVQDSNLAPFMYARMGDIEQSQGKPSEALKAYGAALSGNIPSDYRKLLFSKIKPLLDRDTVAWLVAPWRDEYRRWNAGLRGASPEKCRADTLDSLLRTSSWSRAAALIDSIKPDKLPCALMRSLTNSKIPDSLFPTSRLFAIAVACRSCKLFGEAREWFDKAQKRKNFNHEVPAERALFMSAQVDFDKGNMEAAITQFRRFATRFPRDPEPMLGIARAYRKLDKSEEALSWYKKLLSRNPSYPMAEDILWICGWLDEDLRHYKEAGAVYQKICRTFPKGKRAEESELRRALCFYRIEKYDSAWTMLSKFAGDTGSPFELAGLFWQAKCRLAQDSISAAKALFRDVSLLQPWNYYAHRARQMSALLGDTAVTMAADTVSDIERTDRWLDSISSSSKKQLSPDDSISLLRGIALESVGLTDESDIFLVPLEESFPGNLRLQYNLALLYWIGNSPERAFRVGRSLAWRIPQESRRHVPLSVYKLLYPPFFSETIKYESDRFGLDPSLVSAVIRQESIFNPRIVSPAGAIGLMQIMSYTGKIVAEKIKVPFAPDSLYNPSVNILFGTYYLRELLEQFKDNVVLVLASYNGGPVNVQKWYDHNKDEDYDLFMEDIGFTETRGYVKRVLANYWTYRILSKDEPFTSTR